MSPVRTRGCITFLGILFVAVVFCAIVPFVVMPSLGVGVALPIITVPGEVIVEGGWFGYNLTNTITAVLFVDFLMLAPFVYFAWRSSKGWTRQVPAGFQNLVEWIIEGFYNFARGIAGPRIDTQRPLPLWPLVATIFIFLLAANLMKLFPGVETVGKMHCSHIGYIGYPARQGLGSTYTLYVDAPLNAGTTQTEEAEHACYDYFSSSSGWKAAYPAGFPIENAEEIREQREEYEPLIQNRTQTGTDNLTSEAQQELKQAEAYVELAPARIASAEAIVQVERQLAELDAEIASLEGAAHTSETEAHGEEEEAHGEEEANTDAETTEGDVEETVGEGEESPVTVDEAQAEAAEEAAEAAAEDDPAAALQDLQAQRDALLTELNLHHSQLRYPGATVPLTNAQMDNGAIPFLFHITPFFRGAATDLSLTFALAIISIVMVQAYGVSALGFGYFEKFVNITALGNLGKRPLGAIDFVVGLIEIISELGKIISLAFRLFGNLFAGGVALIAITFLVSWLIPGVIFGLEIIIGSIQALVFAVLTLVFSVQSMESHHGDDHGHDDHGHDNHGDAAHH